MIKKLTLTLLLGLAANIGFAQLPKIAFEKYGVAEGLPEEQVFTPLQDDKGFVWFGTSNGLVKYDGYRFKVYKRAIDKKDTSGFQIGSLVGGLLKAKNGKIWMAERGALGLISSFDPATEQFRYFYPEGNTVERVNNNASTLLFEDETGNIWFRYSSDKTEQVSTCVLNPTNGIIKRYPITSGDVGLLGLVYRSFGTVESSGSIWLLDIKKNLNRLNRQKDRFEIIIPAGKDLLLSGKADTIRQLSKASANRLLLTGTHGLYIFDSKQQKIIKSYVHQPGNTNTIADSVVSAKEDLKGQIWLIHQQGNISLINPASDNIQTFSYGSSRLPYQKGIKEISRFFPIQDNKEGIWFQARGYDARFKFFIYYHFAKKTFSLYDYNFNLPKNPLPSNLDASYFSLEDRSGLLWLGTRSSFYKQAPKKQQMDLFQYRADEPNGLPSDNVSYLFEDSKKRLWIGTQNGLAIYQPGQENFRVFRNNPSNLASLSDNRINMVQEDVDGKIWVCTQNGLNLWQESSGSFKRFFYSTKEVNNIAFLFPDKQQRLWLSIYDKGVLVLDKNTGKMLKSFLPDDKNPASLTDKNIDIFYQDSRENIWLGNRMRNNLLGGLYRLNAAGNVFKSYRSIPGDSSSIVGEAIRFIAEDGKKRLWIGQSPGLCLYDFANDRFIRYYDNLGANTTAFSYVTDKKGEPWFGTHASLGIASVDVEKRRLTAYDESKGLLQNDLYGGSYGEIAKDESGRFWIPTSRGLSVFDPAKKSFVSYFEKDGFQPYNKRYVSIKTSIGDIWIGGSNGLNRIVPANLLKKDTSLPSIVITQMSINDSLYSKADGTIFKQSVAYTNAIELKHWQKNLGFDFVALHYLRSEDNQYSWKLENYDKNWSAPSKERKVSYTNLSPGTYIFRVKASNADGVWNEEGISMTITILPPWWLTWWAYTLYALLFLAALRAFSLWRERKLRQEKEVLQHKVEERTSELKQSLTDLKSTQAQLIQSEKLASLGELTAGIAHEIQNPLNFVNNFSEVSAELVQEIKEERQKPKENQDESLVDEIFNDISQNLEKITVHGKRASSIVKGMLEHSRTSSGEKELTDINALADEYLRLAYHGLRAKDVSFNSDFELIADENLPKIEVIPQDLGRVLLNLINNAFWAVNERSKKGETGFEPKVTVTTQLTANSQVLIAIKDNGTGMSEATKAKIFQPFFTTKPTGQGTGLGLSLSYDIVKAHGGELKVETSEGEGSKFIIQLPF